MVQEVVPRELVVTKREPIPEVHSPVIQDMFNVESVRQHIIANDDHDIPLDEPGLSLELDDEFNEDDSYGESEDGGLNAIECDMVYILSAKYAFPNSLSTCLVVDVEGDDGLQLVPKQEDETPTIEIDSALKKLFMMFSKPNLVMSMHLRPLYAIMAIEGKEINKMIVDSGVVVNIITVRTMIVLGIKKSTIQQTTLSVKNFVGITTKTLGLLFLRVKIGPVDAGQVFFVVEYTAPHSGILGTYWIHKSYCVPSSIHR